MTSKIRLLGIVVISLAIVVAVLILNYYPHLTYLTDSSPVVTQDRSVSEYNKIKFSGIGDLIIVQTGSYGLQISAVQNFLPDIETRVENKELQINYRWDWHKNTLKNQRPVRIVVQVADLQQLSVEGAGIVRSPQLKTPHLEISIQGASESDLKLDVDYLKSEITGAGKMSLSGIAGQQFIVINGAGTYKSRMLNSKSADIRISGLGTAEVDVQNNLNINISGGGKVSYAGNPKVIKEISGLGSVIKLK